MSAELPMDAQAEFASGFRCLGLNAGYGDSTIVRDFDLSCRPGEIVGLIGPNGCGKSTLLKRLAGLLPDQSGRIFLAEREITGCGALELAEMGVRFVPQARDVFPSLTVLENLVVGVRRESRDAAAAQVLEKLPMLNPLLRRRAGRLSGGERKLLGLGRAMMARKVRLALVDEPSAGLSPQAADHVWPLLVQMAEEGAAVLLVEQQVDPVYDLASRVCVMVGGRKRLECDTEQAKGEDLAKLFFS